MAEGGGAKGGRSSVQINGERIPLTPGNVLKRGDVGRKLVEAVRKATEARRGGQGR